MMKLQNVAAVATILAAIFAGLQYYSSNRTPSLSTTASPTELPQALKDQSSKIKLSLKEDAYKKDRQWLLAMREAAKKIPYYDKQRDALIKVVDASLNEADYNMAILCANDIPYYDAKASTLLKIVKAAIEKKEYFGYAVIAADNIPYYDKKSDALNLIIDAYGKQVEKANAGPDKKEPNKLIQPTARGSD